MMESLNSQQLVSMLNTPDTTDEKPPVNLNIRISAQDLLSKHNANISRLASTFGMQVKSDSNRSSVESIKPVSQIE